MPDIAKHTGTVVKADAELVKVKIESLSACASCHARTMCTLSDKEDKIIDVKTGNLNSIPQVGDTVEVSVSTTRGLMATLVAYVIPAIGVVAATAALMLLTGSELLSATAGLAFLAIYYLILYFCRKRLDTKFDFKITEQ